MNTQDSPKEEYVERLFASIAPRYDLLNSILSLNLHRRWRRVAARQCGLSPGDSVVDVCAGTLDFAVELSKAVGPSGRIAAVDLCRPMLEIGRRKLEKRGIGNVLVVEGNAEWLPVPSDSFRAAAIGFALRNVASVENTLAEMTRVVAPGGRVVALELARPRGPVFRRINELSLRAMPLIGGAVSGHREAYDYLPESIRRFHSREELAEIMQKVGLGDIKVYDLTCGSAAVHVGIKR